MSAHRATGVKSFAAETARDTLAWLRSDQDAARTGLTRAEEEHLIEEWNTIRA